jgi:hypothetical protein
MAAPPAIVRVMQLAETDEENVAQMLPPIYSSIKGRGDITNDGGRGPDLSAMSC